MLTFETLYFYRMKKTDYKSILIVMFPNGHQIQIVKNFS